MAYNDIMYLQKKRAAEEDKFNRTVNKYRTDDKFVRPIEEKFTSTNDGYEDMLKEETVGLSSLAEYAMKKEKVEQAVASNDVKFKKRNVNKRGRDDKDENRASHERSVKRSKLSFADDVDQDDEDAGPPIGKRSLKNPTVDTSFLPDKERDEQERKEKILQKQLWIDRQERIKAEMLDVDFNFFDGTTHMSRCTLKKAQTVHDVLEHARRTLQELRKLSSDKLIFVKNELIIPGYLSFYELIETYGEAGPNHEGPLAFWDNDSNLKHHYNIPKIMERKLYEKNRHIYPYTLWEAFDEIKQKEYLDEIKRKEKEKSAPSLLS